MVKDNEVKYSVLESELNGILKNLDEALNSKIPYNKDKIVMAEDSIDLMKTKIKLVRNALGRIRGDSCRP